MSLNSVCMHREGLVFNNYLNQVVVLCWKLQLLVNLKYIFYLCNAIEQILLKDFCRHTEGKECWHQRFVKSKLFPTSLSSVMKCLTQWMKGEQQRSFFFSLYFSKAFNTVFSSIVIAKLGKSRLDRWATRWVDIKGNGQQFKVQMGAVTIGVPFKSAPRPMLFNIKSLDDMLRET